MNQYPMWKYLLIVVLVAVGFVYALPNLYGEDPAVQITGTRNAKVTTQVQDEVLRVLSDAGLEHGAADISDGNLLVRFADTEIQLKAKDVIKAYFDKRRRDYLVALNLAPRTPDWLLSLGAEPMYLGLDLRGGVHFLMEVDMEAAMETSIQRYYSETRSLVRENRLRGLIVDELKTDKQLGVKIRGDNPESLRQIREITDKEFEELSVREGEEDGRPVVYLLITEQEQKAILESAMNKNITALRRRVNELGVAEPIVQRQGSSRIVVQLPGVQDTADAKRILGTTATLEYRAEDTGGDALAAERGRVPLGSKLYRDRAGRPVLLKREVIVTGENIVDARSGKDAQNGSPAVFVTLDGKGAKRMLEFTKANVGKPMAVVFIEKSVKTVIGPDGTARKLRETREEVISIASIREPFGRKFQTTGLDSPQEAHDLALLLRAGALAAPIEIVEERTIGPMAGKQNIRQGRNSVVIGFVLVLAFMVLWYKGFGLAANLALGLNLVLIVAVLSMLQATLTLPGIAGIVLTVGMAVDANVLIFERIREEIRAGNSPHSSIHAGYDKAFSTIFDANFTTLIASLVLFVFGTGPIKGFAITLSIGIVTSMFTAIMVTRAVVNLVVSNRRLSKLSI